jgi:site-specific DNA recombinase
VKSKSSATSITTAPDTPIQCQGNPALCRRRYVREEVLEQKFTELLGQLWFDDEVLEWVRESLHASHTDERREHEEAISRLQTEHKRLGDRINAMYLDKLDGQVDGAFFDKMSARWREEQNGCLREIARHESAERSYLDEGLQILELGAGCPKAIRAATTARKTQAAQFRTIELLLGASFRQPFDLLTQTTAIATRAATGSDSKSAKSEIWLPEHVSIGYASSARTHQRRAEAPIPRTERNTAPEQQYSNSRYHGTIGAVAKGRKEKYTANCG